MIPIIFKNCTFSKVNSRNCFYQEKAQTVEMRTNHAMYERIASGQDELTIRINDELRRSLQVGDRVIFINSSEPKEKYEAFITWIYRAETVDSFFNKLEQRMPYKDFDEYRERLDGFYSPEQIEQEGLIGFSFKHFDERRHWENLEDINRQMKRSLEDSRDWQKAGDFYVGEMSAMRNRLDHSGEKPLYCLAMKAYGFMTGYCESVYRIFVHMLVSIAISLLVLLAFTQGSVGFGRLLEYNLGLFIPLLGGKSITLQELGLAPWQNIVMMFLIIWYYLIWFFLALTLQRKFKR